MFTVVGFWPDTDQRFCDAFAAEHVEEAQSIAAALWPGLAVVAVFDGKLEPADTETAVTYN